MASFPAGAPGGKLLCLPLSSPHCGHLEWACSGSPQKRMVWWVGLPWPTSVAKRQQQEATHTERRWHAAIQNESHVFGTVRPRGQKGETDKYIGLIGTSSVWHRAAGERGRGRMEDKCAAQKCAAPRPLPAAAAASGQSFKSCPFRGWPH